MGGTAKSTLSFAVARTRAFRNVYGQVTLVELDSQGTLADRIGERIALKRKMEKLVKE